MMEREADTSERRHLEEILEQAREQLIHSEEELKNKEEEILEAKREQREHTANQLGNLYSQDGFEELVELSQYANQISMQITGYDMVEQKISRLRKIIKTPYFARIDFTFQGEDTPEQIYIGRFTLNGKKDYDIRIHDWRSPIASVFYRYGIGEAQYQSPSGIIQGLVSLKRQYEIKDSRLEYYFDSELEIMDEFLKRLLSQNASQSMHAIVETIQRDQDVVIRDLKSDVMMVQGVAGSGKTSVALHRAAFLMYQGAAAQLGADNILILSPNSLFEQYIARVLPELGEENVVSCLFEDIIDTCIHPKKLQSYREFLELSAESRYQDGIMARSFAYKTSPEFIEVMKKYAAADRERRGGRELYRKLLEEKKGDGGIFDYSLDNMGTRTLYYDDALCICYFHLLQTGQGEDAGRIRHVMVDEVQDYTPLHFEILKILYPLASFTVLGDINQSIGRKVTLDFYEQIGQILNKPKTLLATMNKSFRCSRQILEFSAGFLENPAEVESFCRDGDEPVTYLAETAEELDELIGKEVELCLEKGYESVALITENQKAADALHVRLAKSLPESIRISAVRDDNESPLTKVFTTPLYMAKGLEFDCVLIVGMTKRRHLYIASTRALHRLSVFRLAGAESAETEEDN